MQSQIWWLYVQTRFRPANTRRRAVPRRQLAFLFIGCDAASDSQPPETNLSDSSLSSCAFFSRICKYFRTKKLSPVATCFTNALLHVQAYTVTELLTSTFSSDRQISSLPCKRSRRSLSALLVLDLARRCRVLKLMQ